MLSISVPTADTVDKKKKKKSIPEVLTFFGLQSSLTHKKQLWTSMNINFILPFVFRFVKLGLISYNNIK